METLNVYCYLHLFQFLSPRDKLRFSTVCTKWKTIMNQFHQVSKLVIIEESVDRKWINGGENEEILIDDFMNFLKYSGCSLKVIEIIRTNRHSHLWGKRLTIHLESWNFSINSIQLDYSYTGVLLQHCNRLTSLKIDYPQCAEWENLKKYIKSNNQLKTLKIGKEQVFPRDMKKRNMSPLFRLTVKNLNMKMGDFPTSLEQLFLNNVHIDYDVFDGSVSKEKKLSKLRSLVLTGAMPNNDFFVQLPECTKHLKVLEIDCKQIFAHNLTVLTKLTHLEKLNLKNYASSMLNDILKAVATSCKKLREIEINKCAFIENDTINDLAGLSKLQRLILRKLYHQNVQIELKKSARNIRSLVVQNCNSFLDFDKTIIKMPHLQYLEIVNCSVKNITSILPVMKIILARNRNFEMIQRIGLNDAQKICVRKKPQSGEKIKEKKSRANWPFRLVWLYTVEKQITFSLLHGIFSENESSNFSTYKETREMIKKVVDEIGTHFVVCEKQRSRLDRKK